MSKNMIFFDHFAAVPYKSPPFFATDNQYYQNSLLDRTLSLKSRYLSAATINLSAICFRFGA